MTIITNFDKRDLPIYKEAIRRHGGKRLWLREKGIGDAEGPSLHSNLSSLSHFWNIFYTVAAEMGGTVVQKALQLAKARGEV